MRSIRTLFCISLFLFGAQFANAQTALPSPWASRDIGAPSLAGSATYTTGTFTIRAAGADIWGTSDQFHFVYRTLSGDGEIVARVGSLTNTQGWAKAGVMIRESLTAGSRYALTMVSATNGAGFQQRVTTNALSTSLKGTSGLPPRWLRLVRKANTYTGYESTDGVTWRLVGSGTISMASSVYVGLAVTSHRAAMRTTANLDNVRFTAAAANQLPVVSITSPATGSTYVSPATINLQASATDADGAISKVEFFSGSTLIGTVTSAPYTLSWSNVPAGGYSLTAAATDNLGARSTCAARSVTVTGAPGPLPAPWSSEDVGGPALAGDASETGGTFTIAAAGRDIWGSADQFHYVHQLLTGDGEIIARVQSLVPVQTWSKAGVMMRESLAPGSKHASMFATGYAGMAFQRRNSTDSTSVHTSGSAVNAPYWVRLVRRGDLFEAYEAPDGAAWRSVGTTSIPMLQTIYVGLAVTSIAEATATTSVISNVTVSSGQTTNQPPTIALTAPANGASYTAPATISVAANASDGDGTVARVDFYRDTTLIASDTTSPYSATWSSAAAGTYTLTAVATDDQGDATTSNAVTVAVNASTNQLPTVTLTSPVAGNSFSAPTTVALLASASDADGTIARVEFYAGTTLVGTDTTSPYAVNWINGSPGSYSLTAVATDNTGGRRTSAAVTVTLRAAQAEFTPSADHSTLVTSYRLEIFSAGANPATATPVATKDLGKPAPVNGSITADFTAALQPLALGSYIVTVSAVGTGGEARSAAATLTR
jgi:regulation of enolase protein 1 (concanavalin A-like superfamily)